MFHFPDPLVVSTLLLLLISFYSIGLGWICSDFVQTGWTATHKNCALSTASPKTIDLLQCQGGHHSFSHICYCNYKIIHVLPICLLIINTGTFHLAEREYKLDNNIHCHSNKQGENTVKWNRVISKISIKCCITVTILGHSPHWKPGECVMVPHCSSNSSISELPWCQTEATQKKFCTSATPKTHFTEVSSWQPDLQRASCI